MQTTIDAAGRIVVPKSLRDAMQLTPGQVVDIVFTDGRLEIDVPSTPARLVTNEHGHLVAITDQEIRPLTTDLVRDVLEQVRR